MVSLAAEFPNDNPALHRGAIWVCLDTTGAASAIEPDPQPWVEPVGVAAEPVVAVVAALVEVAAAEVVDSSEPQSVSAAEIVAPAEPALVLEPVIAKLELEEKVVPAARISGVVARMERFEIEDEDDVDSDGEAAILVEELPPLGESVSVEGAVVGVVAGVAFVGPSAVENVSEIVESARPGLAATYPRPSDDPFTILLCTLADIAVAEGSPNIASVLPGLLLEGCLDHALPEDAVAALAEADVVRGTLVTPAFVAQSRAWRAILDGSSDDFGACGNAMLDEWAADLLARLLGAPAKATALRRELRSRGVAAFGLIAA